MNDSGLQCSTRMGELQHVVRHRPRLFACHWCESAQNVQGGILVRIRQIDDQGLGFGLDNEMRHLCQTTDGGFDHLLLGRQYASRLDLPDKYLGGFGFFVDFIPIGQAIDRLAGWLGCCRISDLAVSLGRLNVINVASAVCVLVWHCGNDIRGRRLNLHWQIVSFRRVFSH